MPVSKRQGKDEPPVQKSEPDYRLEYVIILIGGLLVGVLAIYQFLH